MQTTQNKKFHNQSHREVRTQPSLFCYAIFYSSFIIPYIFRFENFPIKQKKARTFKVLACLHERAGIRTPDNLIKSQVLYHLSYTPVSSNMQIIKENAQNRNRTSDTRIFSPLLYQLSYLGIHHISYCQCKLRGQDLNLRPSGYEPDELPDCSTPRY